MLELAGLRWPQQWRCCKASLRTASTWSRYTMPRRPSRSRRCGRRWGAWPAPSPSGGRTQDRRLDPQRRDWDCNAHHDGCSRLCLRCHAVFSSSTRVDALSSFSSEGHLGDDCADTASHRNTSMFGRLQLALFLSNDFCSSDFHCVFLPAIQWSGLGMLRSHAVVVAVGFLQTSSRIRKSSL